MIKFILNFYCYRIVLIIKYPYLYQITCYIKSAIIKSSLLILFFSLAGCISSKYVEQKQYLLNTKIINNKYIANNKKTTIYINRVIAKAPFDQLNFLYKINKYQYLTDYYNGFLAPQAQQIEITLKNYIKNSNNFILQNNASTASNNLTAEIDEFYADYSDNKNPKAVISIHFILMRSNKVVFDKIFTQKIMLQTKNTENLLISWNIGLQNILIDIAKTLNQCIK